MASFQPRRSVARDRRGRGTRGPVSLPNRYTRRRIPDDVTPRELFRVVVHEAVATFDAGLLMGERPIRVVIEEAPMIDVSWRGAIPTSTIRHKEDHHQVVVFRRAFLSRVPEPADWPGAIHALLSSHIAAVWRLEPDE